MLIFGLCWHPSSLVSPASKCFENQPAKASELPCKWHQHPTFSQFCPITTSHWAVRWCLFCLLGHYSTYVPYDFANFVAHLTFRWRIYACVVVYQGLDNHVLPSIHYLIFPWPSHPIYMVSGQGNRVGWVVSVGLPLGTFFGLHPSTTNLPFVVSTFLPLSPHICQVT